MKIKKNKNIEKIFIVFLFALCIISTVYAEDTNVTNNYDNGTSYYITSDLSNDEIQTMISNANNGDTIEFTSENYDNISLIINKQLKIISNKNSTINTKPSIDERAQNFGINNTFGFYFMQNSSGSILSGFNIIATSTDYAIILDKSSNTNIENNTISNAINNVLVENTSNVSLNNNYIHNASNNSLQVQNTSNISILNNTIAFNGKSGIETSNIYDSLISWNKIFSNSFNGISMYNISSNNNITYNHIYENTNGIFINSQSCGDNFQYNTLEYNRMDPDSELGGFETGNGLLFGEYFETIGKNTPNISYNALMHNENFQAKNNPLKETFKLGPNYFDSNDDVHTFICPMLLAKILTMDFTSVSNGIGIQIYEDDKPINDFAFFNQKIIVDGKEYTVEIQNGKGLIKTDTSQNHEVEIKHGDKIPDYRKETVEKYNPNYEDNSGQGSGSSSSSTSEFTDKSSSTTDVKSDSHSKSESSISNISSNATSALLNDQYSNTGKYGINNSNTLTESNTQTGDNELSQGQDNVIELDSDNSGETTSTQESKNKDKSYELYSVSKKSNILQDNSVAIILAIILLVFIFIYGYMRKNRFE